MSGALRSAHLAHHYREAPQQTDADGSQHWITRAANFVIDVTQAKADAKLSRSRHPDEYMLIVGPDQSVSVSVGGTQIATQEPSLFIIPPGDSEIIVERDNYVVRIFSTKASDVAAKAVNHAMYADGAPEVTPITAWPDPVGGFKLRHYPLSRYDGLEPHPLGMRLFRSTNLMVNFFLPWHKARDIKKLSPHSHEDFEQLSLCMAGNFRHHLRYPWVPDMTTWREDEHVANASPATLVIPARVIHTSHNADDNLAQLFDIFAPPRMDFSSRPGLVLNEADYPMPQA